MKLQFDRNRNKGGKVLLCPGCLGNNLHQKDIELFERADDEEQGIHVRLTVRDEFSGRSANVAVDNNIEKNPSDRRQGLCVYFSCETCNAAPVLEIYQHKGATIMQFKENSKKPVDKQK